MNNVSQFLKTCLPTRPSEILNRFTPLFISPSLAHLFETCHFNLFTTSQHSDSTQFPGTDPGTSHISLTIHRETTNR